jgi:hypothetical protein
MRVVYTVDKIDETMAKGLVPLPWFHFLYILSDYIDGKRFLSYKGHEKKVAKENCIAIVYTIPYNSFRKI